MGREKDPSASRACTHSRPNCKPRPMRVSISVGIQRRNLRILEEESKESRAQLRELQGDVEAPLPVASVDVTDLQSEPQGQEDALGVAVVGVDTNNNRRKRAASPDDEGSSSSSRRKKKRRRRKERKSRKSKKRSRSRRKKEEAPDDDDFLPENGELYSLYIPSHIISATPKKKLSPFTWGMYRNLALQFSKNLAASDLSKMRKRCDSVLSPPFIASKGNNNFTKIMSSARKYDIEKQVQCLRAAADAKNNEEKEKEQVFQKPKRKKWKADTSIADKVEDAEANIHCSGSNAEISSSMEKDYSPLSLACVKSLSDKSYEKRRQAASEIEKMVKDFTQMKNTEQIKKLLRVLGQDFTMSQMTNWRKGGIIGLASSAMGLGREAGSYIDELILPILHCFNDSDPRARYYACEGLYNVTKVARGAILQHFNEIFNSLSKLAADPDQNVRSGTEMLDRLLKDIVTESASFDLVTFIPLLRERLYTKNTFARQFVISWISVLHAVPDINLVIFLPELLDGLFNILEDPTMEIKKMCETVLGEFLREIIKNPSSADFSGMINILIAHSQSKDELLQLMAATWIKEFVALSGNEMVPYASGILSAVLPCLAYDDDNRKNIRETGKAVNYNLMKLITHLEDQQPSDENTGSDIAALKPPDGDSKSSNTSVDLASVVDVLTRNLQNTAVSTKCAVLRWIYHLHLKMGDQMIRFVDETFPVLLKTLSDPSDEVVLISLEVLAEIVSFRSKNLEQGDGDAAKMHIQNNPYFIKFVVSLLGLFSTDKQLLEDRGAFIIRQLCVLLSAEAIYRSVSEILLDEENLKFANVMVETLNTILLTSAELFDLRQRLNKLSTKESCSLFTSLYRTWAHDPVATVALCLLAKNYAHAYDLIRIFGQIEVTVEFLVEIDKLVQLIESPIFTFLRLDLLDGHHNTELVQALYGLLMLLPQSEGFHVLQRRLNCVPSFHLPPGSKLHGEPKIEERIYVKEIPFDDLLEHFKAVQEKHKRTKQANKTAELIDKGMKSLDI